MNKSKKLAEEQGNGPDRTIMITQKEKENIMHAKNLMNSSTNDRGELVFRLFRMCGFVPVNLPILFGIVFSKPTNFNTIFF